MENVMVVKSNAGNCFILMEKVMSIPKLQKLCRDITCELVDNCFFGSDANFVISKDDIQIVVFIRDYDTKLLGTAGFICKQIDDDTDYLEMVPFYSKALSEEWTNEEWCTLCDCVSAYILGTLCS